MYLIPRVYPRVYRVLPTWVYLRVYRVVPTWVYLRVYTSLPGCMVGYTSGCILASLGVYNRVYLRVCICSLGVYNRVYLRVYICLPGCV